MNHLVSDEVINELQQLLNSRERVNKCLNYFFEQRQLAEMLHIKYLEELKRLEHQYQSFEEPRNARTAEMYQLHKHMAMRPLMTLHLNLHQRYWKSIRADGISEEDERRFRILYGELTKDFKDVHEFERINKVKIQNSASQW